MLYHKKKDKRITMRGDRHRWDTCVSLHNVTTSFLSGTRYFCHEAILREHFQRNWGKCKPRLAARPLIKNTGIQAKGGYLYFYSSIDHHRWRKATLWSTDANVYDTCTSFIIFKIWLNMFTSQQNTVNFRSDFSSIRYDIFATEYVIDIYSFIY